MGISDDREYAETPIPLSEVFEDITMHVIYNSRQPKQFFPLLRGGNFNRK